jgi:preprotein translocase subunit YajC
MEALIQIVPLVAVFAIMWLLLIRPQQRKAREHLEMVKALRRGDQVVTQGGILGKVTKVKDDTEIEVEVAPGVNVRVQRSAVSAVVSRTEPAKA